MARAIDKRIMLDLIIEAKKTDPETVPFSEWLAEYLVDHLPTLTPPNEWVSVDERLPEHMKDVIVLYGGGEIDIDWVDSLGDFRFDNLFGRVTHWMPLPAPPAKEDQK